MRLMGARRVPAPLFSKSQTFAIAAARNMAERAITREQGDRKNNDPQIYDRVGRHPAAHAPGTQSPRSPLVFWQRQWDGRLRRDDSIDSIDRRWGENRESRQSLNLPSFGSGSGTAV